MLFDRASVHLKFQSFFTCLPSYPILKEMCQSITGSSSVTNANLLNASPSLGRYHGDKAAQLGCRGINIRVSSFTHLQLSFFPKLRYIDFDKREHRSPEFFRLNPLHQVPTLDDNGFVINDSHAIISYFAGGTPLTSPDHRVLARINQILFYDFELFRVLGEVFVSSAKSVSSSRSISLLPDSIISRLRARAVAKGFESLAREARCPRAFPSATKMGFGRIFDSSGLLLLGNFLRYLRELNFKR